MGAWKVRQQKEELERQKKALETKQKIEELRQTKIAEAKKREEEQLQKESEAKKQSGEKKKQDEERLAHLRMEVEQRRQLLPEVSAGALSIDEAISRINKLQAALAEIEVKISEAVKQVGMDYARQMREADASPKDEYETSADYQKRVTAAEEKKRRLSEEQKQAEENVREEFSASIKSEIDNLLKAEYPVPSNEISFTLGQYDADAEKMPLQIIWTHYKLKDKMGAYLKMEGKDAKVLKEHKDFLRAKGWVRISESLQPTLRKIEVIDDADNQRSIQGYLHIVSLIGLQWAQDAGGKKMTWDEANDYVQKLRLGGYSDWRLPTKEELESLLSYCKSKGVQVEKGECPEYFNKTGFKNVQSDIYWSSMSGAYGSITAWGVVTFRTVDYLV